jgi:hypothetical protein
VVFNTSLASATKLVSGGSEINQRRAGCGGLNVHQVPSMARTATERSRVLRERRAHGKVVLTVVVGEDELAESARAGYANAVSASSAPPLIERENARAPP